MAPQPGHSKPRGHRALQMASMHWASVPNRAMNSRREGPSGTGCRSSAWCASTPQHPSRDATNLVKFAQGYGSYGVGRQGCLPFRVRLADNREYELLWDLAWFVNATNKYDKVKTWHKGLKKHPAAAQGKVGYLCSTCGAEGQRSTFQFRNEPPNFKRCTLILRNRR